MRIIDVSKKYGDKTIFDRFNLYVEKGKITAKKTIIAVFRLKKAEKTRIFSENDWKKRL